MSDCGEPCDGCPNRAEHHLCDACCHDEVDAIQKENRELREKLEWQAACTKALMESQERLAAELKDARTEVDRLAVQLKEARAECARQMEYGVKQHEAAQDAIRERDEAQAWAKERSEFAAAETEHANRWSVRAHKAEAEVERLRGEAAAWKAHSEAAERFRKSTVAEAEAEVEQLTTEVAQWKAKEMRYLSEDVPKAFDAGYRRGAEAMREEAAIRVDGEGVNVGSYFGCIIRDLPIPEDKS